MDAYSIFRLVSPHFRRKRMQRFVQQMRPTRDCRILDIGGYPGFWADADIDSEVTVLNLHIYPNAGAPLRPRVSLVIGDGTKLDYPDQAFDIVFSNSVIEHLRSYEQQVMFAGEARRVGKRVWIQTPAKSFFIEPHLLTPCVHWLPKNAQIRLSRRFTVWGWLTNPTPQQAFEYVDELRLLSKSEMSALFPDCRIQRETVCGLTKSFIAVR